MHTSSVNAPKTFAGSEILTLGPSITEGAPLGSQIVLSGMDRDKAHEAAMTMHRYCLDVMARGSRYLWKLDDEWDIMTLIARG